MTRKSAICRRVRKPDVPAHLIWHRDRLMMELRMPLFALPLFYPSGHSGHSRGDAMVRHRHALVRLMRERPLAGGQRLSMPEIARAVGYRSHATVAEIINRTEATKRKAVG